MKNFAQNWLDIQCQCIDGLNCALFLLTDVEKTSLKPAAQWPLDSKEALELVAISKIAVKKSDSIVNSNIKDISVENQTFDYIAVPIYVEKQLLGIIAIKTTHHDQQTQQKILHTLNVGSKWLAMSNDADATNGSFYKTVVRLAVSCLQQDTVNKAFTVLINEFTSEFSCQRVAIGEVNNQHAQVFALSNSARFNDKSNLIRGISAAMDETIDQDRVIVYPEDADEKTAITHAHKELARKFGSGSICTIPLVYEESIFAVLTMERNEANPFDQEAVNICQQTLSLISTFLKLKQQDEKSLIQKLGGSVKRNLKVVFGYQYLGLKLFTLFAIAFTCFAALTEGDFRIHADAKLEGRIQRSVSAPLDGFIKSAHVRAGSKVMKGEVMVVMEDTEIKLEKVKLNSERQQVQREYREAMANRELVQVSVLNAQMAQIEAKIKLNQEQLERTLIQSPFDGIVIEGDLSQSLGAPVDRGDSLFTIAPLDGYRVILNVNERSISYIRHGQTGVLALSSLPGRTFLFQIEKITEVANADDGSNIFRVEAALAESPKILRPGMEGVGKIEIGQEKLLWIWTHEMIDWLKLWVWSWWP